MQAFHNSNTVKTERLLRVQNHMSADNLVRGETGHNGKGCAVWCTLDKYDHKSYESELGIPEWLARVEDTLFEGMSIEKSKTWPKVFLEAINVGADLEKAKGPFLILVMQSVLKTITDIKIDADKFPDVAKSVEGSKAAVNASIALWQRDDAGSDQWQKDAAADAAYAADAADAAYAAYAAADAAAYAADAADAAYAAYAAAHAARAADAADAAYAAYAAAHAARAADAAYAAYAAAYAVYDNLADGLLEILRGIEA